jgi:hypothetical protein
VLAPQSREHFNKYMKDKKIEISGLVEANTNWLYHDVGTTMNKAAHKQFTNYSYNIAGIAQEVLHRSSPTIGQGE